MLVLILKVNYKHMLATKQKSPNTVKDQDVHPDPETQMPGVPSELGNIFSGCFGVGGRVCIAHMGALAKVCFGRTRAQTCNSDAAAM